MSETSSDKMPKGMLAAARWAAERTPESRNRAVDLYRAIAIIFVILGHWLLVAAYMNNGQVELVILLAEQPWTHYATWLFQVMPVFFFVGGFSNGLSWASAQKDPEKRRVWAATRLSRLLKPTIPVVVFWTLGAFIASLWGVSTDLIAQASQAALVPVWFLAVYIIITMAVPVTAAFWDKYGIGSVLILVAGAISVDIIAFGFDQQWLRWINYAFVWLAVHQLGYWWRTAARPAVWALGFVLIGVAWLYALIAQLGFPVAMVSVPGEEISNTRPPTTAMLAVGSLQIGVILLATGPVSRWLMNVRRWSVVILLNQMIMSIYLWHMTALIIVVGISVQLLGGFGLTEAPGSGAWWAARPIWILLFTLLLMPFVLLFISFELPSRTAIEKRPSAMQASLGAFMACAGLVMMALNGLGADALLGINWLAVGLMLSGIYLATRKVLQS
ncbi:MAG: acyltransferase [Pseudomonadota bacterium]